MDKAEVKSFGLPDEVREFPHGRLELLDVGGAIVGRAVLEPLAVVYVSSTYRWNEELRSPSFSVPRFRCAAGKMDDGSEFDCKPGELSRIPPCHDARVVGDESVVIVDFRGMVNWAKHTDIGCNDSP